MWPTLKPGQIVVASPYIKPKFGRVIIATQGDKEIIKRVLGVSDDRLKLAGDNPNKAHNATVHINDFIATKIF